MILVFSTKSETELRESRNNTQSCMVNPITISTIILAGGNSSRMGQDKALMSVAGTPMLQFISQIALECTPSVHIVTPWPQKYQKLLATDQHLSRHCYLIPEMRSQNHTEPHGPLLGFVQGLQQVSTEWVMLLACDLPRLKSAVLKTGIAQLSQISADAIALLFQQDKGWEPLCGFYRQNCLNSLNRFIESGGRSFQTWLKSETVAPWFPSDPTIFFNCNTPTDFQQL